MKLWLLVSTLAAVWPAAQGATLKNGFMLTKDQPSTFEDPPLIPDIHAIGMLESKTLEEPASTPEGGFNPLTYKPNVKWPEQSSLAKPLQWLLGGCWIFMLASMPFIIPVLDQKPVTKTQMIVGGSMLVVLFGGFYLFTNIILFQSVHFKAIRPLTIVECIYFMSQLITTVGYGDIGPAKPRGQVFVGLYVLGALFVIAMLVSDLTKHIAKSFKDYKEKRFRAAHPDSTDIRVHQSLHSLIAPEPPSTIPFLTSVGIFIFIDICWVAFFSTYPGEEKTVFQAIYMSIITLSTVGLGWFTPLTEGGMIFGAFFMLFGSIALLNVIGNFTELMGKLSQYERFKDESREEVLAKLKHVSSDLEAVNELSFYKFSLLHCGVSQDSLDHISEAFERLNPEKGVVALKVLHKALEEAPETPRPE